jgi:hypothetical protein
MKDTWVKKGLVVSVILLFIGVAVAPSINFNVVKASNDNDLVEVTTQACGIKGYGNTTVKLTREQYQNLEQYLVDFRARLNQTTTREEAVPIFKDAVVELDKYGLLPKGMRVEKAQKIFENLFKRHHKTLADNENFLCLIAGRTNETYFSGILPNVLWYVHYWIPHPFDDVFLQAIIWPLTKINQYQPFILLADIILYEGAVGWVWTLGLLGVKTWKGTLIGAEPSPYWEPYIAAFGFTGIKILLNSNSWDIFYFGDAWHVRIENIV